MALTLLEQIQKRTKSRAGNGIGLAVEYVKSLEECAGGGDNFKKFLTHFHISGWSKAIKEAEGRLVYRNDKCEVIGGVKTTDAGLKVFENPVNKGALKTSGAIMGFDCVLTSRRQDRDGDVLEPKGAKIDAKMPLLWQHIPMEPIGKYIETVDRNDEIIRIYCEVANTKLGNDAATLIEFGGLRISQGFIPSKFKPLEDSKDPAVDGTNMPPGWHVEEYETVEASTVSIPSNKDAIITAFSREKLFHPLVKLWAGAEFDARPTTVKGNWDGGGQTININVMTKGVKADEEEEEEEEKPAEKPEGEGDKAGEDGKKTAEEDKVMVAEIVDMVTSLSKVPDLPQEAIDRINTVSGMLTTIQTQMDECSAKLATANDAGDISAIMEEVGNMIAQVGAGLAKVSGELENIAKVEGMPEGATKIIGDISAKVQTFLDSIQAVTEGADEVGETDSDEDSEIEWDDDEDKAMDDEDEDEDEEKSKGGGDDDEDDEDDTEKLASNLCGRLIGGASLSDEAKEALLNLLS